MISWYAFAIATHFLQGFAEKSSFDTGLAPTTGLFSPLGDQLVIGTEQGMFSVFSFDRNSRAQEVMYLFFSYFMVQAPRQQFFQHDYSPVIYDSSGNALDEISWLPLHSAERGPLCNLHMVPYERQPSTVPLTG